MHTYIHEIEHILGKMAERSITLRTLMSEELRKIDLDDPN